MKILLVSPQTPDTFWSFKHVLKFVAKKASIPPLGLLTVAAMLPRDWELRLVDLNVERLKDETLRWADCVMISAMIVHQESVKQIAGRCTAHGKRVIAGGPLFRRFNISSLVRQKKFCRRLSRTCACAFPART